MFLLQKSQRLSTRLYESDRDFVYLEGMGSFALVTDSCSAESEGLLIFCRELRLASLDLRSIFRDAHFTVLYELKRSVVLIFFLEF